MINRFVICESKVRSSRRPGTLSRIYRQLILSHLLPGDKKSEAKDLELDFIVLNLNLYRIKL